MNENGGIFLQKMATATRLSVALSLISEEPSAVGLFKKKK